MPDSSDVGMRAGEVGAAMLFESFQKFGSDFSPDRGFIFRPECRAQVIRFFLGVRIFGGHDDLLWKERLYP